MIDAPRRAPRVTRGRRPLPSDLADAARSAVPIGLLILAAAVPPARPVVLVALVAGFAVALGRAAPTCPRRVIIRG